MNLVYKPSILFFPSDFISWIMICQSSLSSGFEQEQQRKFNLSVYLSISAILRLVEQIKSCTITDNVALKPGQGNPRSLFNSCHSKSLMGSISEGISQSAA